MKVLRSIWYKVRVAWAEIAADPWQVFLPRETCARCRGVGETETELPCRHCGGNGTEPR